MTACLPDSVSLTSLFMSSGQWGVALDRKEGRYVCSVLSGLAPNASTLRRGYSRRSCSCRLGVEEYDDDDNNTTG